METKDHYQQMGLHKNKVSVQQKTHSAGKTAHKMGENLYQSYFRQRLISRIYTEFQKLSNTGIKQPFNKWANGLSSQFQSKKYKQSITIVKSVQYTCPSEKRKLKLF